MSKTHVVEVGDRFETRDRRDAGRIVEVREIRQGHDGVYCWVQVEAHPKNPTAVGRHSWVSARMLAAKYRRVTR